MLGAGDQYASQQLLASLGRAMWNLLEERKYLKMQQELARDLRVLRPGCRS